MTGGDMRKAGVLAAADLYALKHNVARLKEDNDNAAWLGEQLGAIGVEVLNQHTNMLFVKVPAEQVEALKSWMQSGDVLISVGPVTRIVTHLDVSRQDLQRLVAHWQALQQ